MACLEDCNDILRQISQLNAKINAFVNGDKDLLIQTDAGTIKTLAGIADAFAQSQYMQKIVDIATIADMNAIAAGLGEGTIVRVFSDINPLNNGLYQKNDLGLMIKIDYTAINDLWQQLPNPWNYKHITLGTTGTIFPKALATFSIPKSVSITSATHLLKWQYDIASPVKASFVGETKISYAVADATEKQSLSSNTVSKLELTTTYTGTNPDITLVITETGSTFEGSILFTPAKTGTTYHTGNLSLMWYNADNSLLNFLV